MIQEAFFKSSEAHLNPVKNKNSLCGKCGLHNDCLCPKMLPGGTGEMKILHLAEAPGEAEDRKKDQLVGSSGSFYNQMFKKIIGRSIHEGCKDNSVRCRPKNNRTPTDKEITCCRPNIEKNMGKFKPKIIILLGGTPIKSILKPKFSGDVGGISKWRGTAIPDREYNCWICPVFHPSYIDRDTTPEVAEKIFKNDLWQIYDLYDKPVPEFLDERQFVEFLKHPKETIAFLKDIIKNKPLTAFDYETTGIKPQNEKQKIKSCAISCGPYHSAVFPFFDDDKFKSFFNHYIENPELKKICANIKFERDWSFVKLGVKKFGGAFFDTMIGMHYLYNNAGTTGLEFQNYVLFGLEPYDKNVAPYLKPKDGRGGNAINDIEQIDLESLLMYNGLDSLTEFRVALVQMDKIGWQYHKYYEGKSGFDLLKGDA